MALPHWLARLNLRFSNRFMRVIAAQPRQFREPSRASVPFVVRPMLAILRVSDFVEMREKV